MKARTLYFFNPDHDLALANGDENFDIPRSARAFGLDVSCLPLWYAEQDSMVLAHLKDKQWLRAMQVFFPQLASIAVDFQPDFSSFDAVCPWGWNAAVRKFLSVQGANIQLLPDINSLFDIRRLSHRLTAVRAMHFLQQDVSLLPYICFPAKELSVDEVGDFALQYKEVVFKAPWSGSGKGLCWTTGQVSDNMLGWCKNIAEKQACVIGEQVYNKVQDFAMEFKCVDGMVSFAGYSLFETESHGVYKSNALMSDDAIINELSKWFSATILSTVKSHLLAFIEKEIAPFYSGYLGVDMFVYQQNNVFMLHPCVEINLRMTMGMVARLFYDNFVSSAHTGQFYVDYFPSSEDLWADHCQREQTMPLQVENERITQGYLSLSPIEKGMKYRVRVEMI